MDPANTWLEESVGNKVFLPQDGGTFNLEELGIDTEFLQLTVAGSDLAGR